MAPTNDVLETRVNALEKRMSNGEADTKELLAYKHSHDPLSRAWWQEQHKWNAQVSVDMATLQTCVISLQKRWLVVAGFAAAFGGGVSHLIEKLLT